MTLDAFMRATGISAEEFAAKVQASPGAVRKWRSGERIPRVVHLRKIREATDGAVTAEDFYCQASEAAA